MRLSSFCASAVRHGTSFGADLITCLRFFTRFPVPPLWFEPADWDPDRFGAALRAAPLAGLVVGAVGAVVLATAAEGLGLPPMIAAIMAVAAQVLASGALHEDGLADVADALGASERPRKLEIMRDSRVGTFGALALVMSVGLRASALAALMDSYGSAALMALLPAAAAVSRGFCLVPLGLLRPARADGLSHAARRLPPGSLSTAVALAVFLGMTLPFWAGSSETRALAACAAALLASLAVTRLAHRQIGGQTGDVAGAAQQAAEIAFLLSLLVAPGLG